MNEFFKIDKRITDASDNALKLCRKQFEYIDEITEYNQQKVQKAFIDNRISESHFCTVQAMATAISVEMLLIRYGHRF